MNVHAGFQPLIAGLFATAFAVSTTFAADPVGQTAGQAQLKWTPHRASTSATATAAAESTPPAPAAEPAPAPVAAPAPAVVPPAGPPASVTLPDGVPAAGTTVRRPQPPAAYAPMRDRGQARGDYASPNRISGAMRQAFDPSNPDGVLGLNVMRSPQGEVGRPILAPEGRQVAAMERQAGRTSARPQAARLGGGLAPRYAAPAGGRPERLAMNAEGIPSVMARAPSVGGLDDTAVPGRTTPGTAAPESLPTPAPAADTAGPTVIETMPDDALPELSGAMPGEYDPGMMTMPGDDGLLMGEYPSELHVESFYDDPYEYEDDESLMCLPHGRICAWLRRFGKPYYGWRWYRDFTASAGITSFTNSSDLGINGNFGTNEYLNWAMPFWNAFGVGWQLGWRGTQTNFQPASVEAGTTAFEKNARTQNFITTGFFTRAFEGRGLQGGAVYDYLSDNWFDNVDVSQIRAEISYVWGYHEIGFWGAANITDQIGFLRPRSRVQGTASTVDLYTGFYRLQFGDANEWKVWGGGTGDGEGIVGTLLRAPLGRTFAMEGTFTYLIPGQTRSVVVDSTSGMTSNFSPAAWNLGLNLVYYPAGRARRSLASPYRPLFEVADNGSMIREFSVTRP